ncbi:MAG: PEP-CTERM sorting domain-containing protein [Proteobacteria bacterium]|nr:PEP-CTERM sorting domain-containing protein [Pseudomonadota bacterium]NBS07377.1 PEP-CTERM sorting domain-containing protein [Verrucomicrobiota bacterium]NBS49673.1 PEP-CTERM sorting domain-containing protein [Verrucomicrobiota bacterium]
MKNKITIAIALLGISLAGSLQAQTVNLINNLQPFYMGNGTTLLKPNTEIYIGTFGTKTTTEIQGLLGSDQSQNYNNLFSNFSILGSYRAQSSEFGVVFGTESGETETGSVIGFNGNQVASFFNNKPMQVLVLSPLNGENSPGNLLEIGVYGAYDFGANAAINFMTADITDVNSFAFATADLVANDPAQIGATAIVGNGGPTGTSSFSLSTSTVPEPSSASLLIFGAAALAALRRLRKNV